MYKYIVFGALMALQVAGSAFASEAPKIYKKCKMCHGSPGASNGKVGPDLATSKWPLEQWQAQTKLGSKRDNRPEKRAKYAKKKMPKQKVTAEQTKAIYDWVHSTH